MTIAQLLNQTTKSGLLEIAKKDTAIETRKIERRMRGVYTDRNGIKRITGK